MVVRSRLRRFLFPLALYCVSGSVATFFVWHANNGDRGLKVSDEYEKSITMLDKQLIETKAQREQWQHRIDLMQGKAIDRDLLEEEGRTLLDRVGTNDLVVFFAQR